MAVLVETPILVDRVAWEQGALVDPAGGELYLCTSKCEQGAMWEQGRYQCRPVKFSDRVVSRTSSYLKCRGFIWKCVAYVERGQGVT